MPTTKKGKKSIAKKKPAHPAAKGLDLVAAEKVVAAARAAAFTDESPPRAFAHFRPLAEEVPTDGLPVFAAQPMLVRANVSAALEAIEPHLVAIAAKLVDAKLQEIFELPSLVMALDFAAGRVPVAKLGAGEIDKLLAEGGPWRELMLSYLEVAAHPLLDLLPRERVAAVRAGTGKLDKARDFVALAGLFTEFGDVLKDKHPFPADKIDWLASLGGTLVQQIRPGKAVAQIAKRGPEAILRDQLGALVVERYDHLQVLAGVAVGRRNADELLPALRSAAVSPVAVVEPVDATADAEPAPAPAKRPEPTPV
jgi:hypothetical protein